MPHRGAKRPEGSGANAEKAPERILGFALLNRRRRIAHKRNSGAPAICQIDASERRA